MSRDHDSWPTLAGTLYGYGALPWADILTTLDGFRGAWGDVDGMHLGEPLPPEAPAYTHVWAWRDGLCARVRLDLPSGRHILGLLVTEGDPPAASALAAPPEPVTITRYPVRGWGGHSRVHSLPTALRDPSLERLVTSGATAATFIRPAGQAK